ELELWFQLGDDFVFVIGRVDGGNEPRTVCGVQRLLDLLRGYAQGRGFVAINVNADLRVLDLQIAGDILQLRELAQLALQLGNVVIQFGDIRALQRILILALGQVAANADGRQILHIDGDARNL